MKVAFSLPVFLRMNPELFKYDFNLLNCCLNTLKIDEDSILVIYNQGPLDKDTLDTILKPLNINYEIIGDGVNVGIPIARQKIFEFVWENYPDIEFQCEIHVDMIFPKEWYKDVVKYLKNSEEPMLSPAIINSFGDYTMDLAKKITIPNNVEEIIKIVEGKSIDLVKDGLVHPAIHNSYVLKQIGGIDLRFFRGKQGYEDYSILIGYHNYIGTRHQWKPKMYGISTVFHGVAQQRWTVDEPSIDISLNQEGLCCQYGAYGIKSLAYMVNDPEYMGKLYENKVLQYMNTNYQFDFSQQNKN